MKKRFEYSLGRWAKSAFGHALFQVLAKVTTASKARVEALEGLKRGPSGRKTICTQSAPSRLTCLSLSCFRGWEQMQSYNCRNNENALETLTVFDLFISEVLGDG